MSVFTSWPSRAQICRHHYFVIASIQLSRNLKQVTCSLTNTQLLLESSQPDLNDSPQACMHVTVWLTVPPSNFLSICVCIMRICLFVCPPDCAVCLHLPWGCLLWGDCLLQGVKHGKGHAGGELSDGCPPLTGPRGSRAACQSPWGKGEEEGGLRSTCAMLSWPRPWLPCQ